MEEILKALIHSKNRKVSHIFVDIFEDEINRGKYNHYDRAVKQRLIDEIRYELRNDSKVEKLEHKRTNQIEYALELFVFNREQMIKLISEILEYGNNNSQPTPKPILCINRERAKIERMNNKEIEATREKCKKLRDESNRAYKKYAKMCRDGLDEEILDIEWEKYKVISEKEILERQKLIDIGIVP